MIRIRRHINEIRKIINKNKIVLGNVDMSIPASDTFGKVAIHWSRDMDWTNFGDTLGPVIVRYMLKRQNIDIQPKKIDKHLYSVGSIIFFGYQNATIWGSGALYGFSRNYKKCKRRLDIRCVRGPLTDQRLRDLGYNVGSNVVYGDPAVLLPLIYKPKCYKSRRYSVILHHNDKRHCENVINIINREWKDVVDEIVQSELIISSSLHGIIVAEAYGVPAVMLEKQGWNDFFKFNDYYYSTGRKNYIIAKTIEEALTIKFPEVPDLKKMRQDLLASFPYDLWE